VGAAIYRGRFAPSPTGALHAGSLVAALASWLDARAHGGQWLVRIEDVDTPRCIPGADHHIVQQLAACGLHPDAPPVWQSQRTALYQHALDLLITAHWAYPCGCSRKDIETALHQGGQARPRHGELIYPGTCRDGLHGKVGRAWRLRVDDSMPNRPLALTEPAQAATHLIAEQPGMVCWHDRRLGAQAQDVAREVGDFVLQRADGLFAYQLAVVVDDAAQGITHVVRGEDLADNTARQILLHGHLGLGTPHYLHTPLVLGANNEKLSKQNGARAIDTSNAQAAQQALSHAAAALGLPAVSALDGAHDSSAALQRWTTVWGERYR
jgi:glutamyl-Q tRNA(Asp) synthetase